MLAIAILASFILFFKFIFAIVYHLKWLCTERCCLQMEESIDGEARVSKINKFWRDEHRNWVLNHQNRDDVSIVYKKGKKK